MRWPFGSTTPKGRHRAGTGTGPAAELFVPIPVSDADQALEWVASTMSVPVAPVPQVGLVFIDGSSVAWPADDPHVLPFVALAKALLLSRESPVRPTTLL